VATARPVERNVSLANYSTEELWTLYPDDFQQLLNGLQKKAVQYPTEQNILEYLSIQDIARRKALAYANATQYVTQKRADLFTLNQVYPVSTPGVAARVRLQQDEISRTIDAARTDHALLFFVAPSWGSAPSRPRSSPTLSSVTAGRCDRWTSAPSRTFPCASR